MQRHLQQVAQDHVQSGSEYLQGQRLHDLSKKPIPEFNFPHSKNLLMFKLNFCSISFCPWPLSCSLDTMRKCQDLASLVLSIGYLHMLTGSYPNLPFPRLDSPGSLSLSSHNCTLQCCHFSGSAMDFLQ